MFKSLQTKLVTIFVLIVLAIMTVAGTFLVLQVYFYHHDNFNKDMTSVFTEDYVKVLNTSVDTAELTTKAMQNSSTLKLSDNRKLYVIDTIDGTIINTSETSDDIYIDSANYLSVLSGASKNKPCYTEKYMDYAVMTNLDTGKYLIYIKDNKTELFSEINKMIIWYLEILIGGVLLFAIFTVIYIKKITKPIKALTKSAMQMSEGEFDTRIEQHKSTDEIGILVDAFNDMSLKFQKTISEFVTEKNKIEAIIQNMTDGVVAFDTKGKIIHINSTARKMLGMEKIEKYKFDRLFSELDANIKIGDLLYLGDTRVFEREITKDDLTIKANFTVFNNEKKKNDGVLVMLHDVTKQQQLEMSRREFVANVSHELKTPLTTVKSHAETLLDIIGEDKTAESFANTILNETDRMTRLVKDLLLISSLEGKMLLNRTTFSLKAMINDVVSTMSLVASEKGHRLNFEAIAEIPDFYGDRDKLEQVLYNVISNSIKYTPNGGKIGIRAGKLYGDFFVEVSDNGIGIPESDLERIFERFYRVDKARSRELGGTGLGLSISKSIIDAHGGTIKVESTVGEGTKVIIFLPVTNEDKMN